MYNILLNLLILKITALEKQMLLQEMHKAAY